jgi:hypothetical protein
MWSVVEPSYFDIGDELTFSAQIKDSSGQLTDPSDVLIYLGNPTADPAVQSFSYLNGDIVRDGVGVYHFDFIPPVHGWWEFKWQGTGVVITAGEDTLFYVRPSFAIPEPFIPNNWLVDSAGDQIVDTSGDLVTWS